MMLINQHAYNSVYKTTKWLLMTPFEQKPSSFLVNQFINQPWKINPDDTTRFFWEESLEWMKQSVPVMESFLWILFYSLLSSTWTMGLPKCSRTLYACSRFSKSRLANAFTKSKQLTKLIVLNKRYLGPMQFPLLPPKPRPPKQHDISTIGVFFPSCWSHFLTGSHLSQIWQYNNSIHSDKIHLESEFHSIACLEPPFLSLLGELALGSTETTFTLQSKLHGSDLERWQTAYPNPLLSFLWQVSKSVSLISMPVIHLGDLQYIPR